MFVMKSNQSVQPDAMWNEFRRGVDYSYDCHKLYSTLL